MCSNYFLSLPSRVFLGSFFTARNFRTIFSHENENSRILRDENNFFLLFTICGLVFFSSSLRSLVQPHKDIKIPSRAQARHGKERQKKMNQISVASKACEHIVWPNSRHGPRLRFPEPNRRRETETRNVSESESDGKIVFWWITVVNWSKADCSSTGDYKSVSH